MNKSFKLTALFLLVITLFITSSCLHDKDDERTEEKESSEITNFILLLQDEGYNVDTTASGMYYIMHEKGSGAYPQEGDTCYVEYVGYYINGAIFDASANHYEDETWEVIYKETNLIEGFEEAIGLMKSGGEATFIIPSKLAYGGEWNDIIPPYTTLIFDMNMHDISPKTPE